MRISGHGERSPFDHDRLLLITSFVAVAERSSFAKAAQSLNILSSTVSRHVARLEAILNTRLLSRTTRSVALTEAGQIYYQECCAVLQRLSQADSLVAAYCNEPRGLLRVSMPVAFGLRHMTQALFDFRLLHPDIRIEAHYEDNVIDVVAAGYDLAIRIGSLRDSGLIARKLAPTRRHLVASPGYIERFGTPSHPSDLSAHNCLRYSRSLAGGTQWLFREDNIQTAVDVKGDFISNSIEAVYQSVLAGVGIGLVPAYLAEDSIQRGALIPLLPQWMSMPEANIYAVFPTTVMLPSKVRLFIEFISARFRAANWKMPDTDPQRVTVPPLATKGHELPRREISPPPPLRTPAWPTKPRKQAGSHH